VSSSLYDLVSSVNILDNGFNLWDHCAVELKLNLPVDNEWKYKSQSKFNVNCYTWRWDKADLWNYYLQTFQYLSTIDTPLYLLHMDSLGEISRLDIQTAINCYYQSIVSALQDAALQFIPKKSLTFYKYWWDKELSALKQASFDYFKIWEACGKLKHGNVFEAIDGMLIKLRAPMWVVIYLPHVTAFFFMLMIFYL